jgi:predicted ATP-binding protein involved in virulence
MEMEKYLTQSLNDLDNAFQVLKVLREVASEDLLLPIEIALANTVKHMEEAIFDQEDNVFVSGKTHIDELSPGYKSMALWVFDLVVRLIDNQPHIKELKDYEAIVLIDDVDIHLSPRFKYNFMHKIRKIFPKIQFIVSCNSTETILGASEDAVFYKVYKEDGATKISQPMHDIKNFMANSLSTSPLFDMDTARARNNDNNLDTREDFISSKIHNIIKERVKGKKAIVEDEIVDMINQELDNYLKENGYN